jgi:hypothetical protein
MGIKVRLINARVAFAQQLFQAEAFEEGKTPKFGADFLLTPGSQVVKVVDGKAVPTTMEAVMQEVANEAWKGKGAQMLASLEASKKCFRNGDLRVTRAGDPYEGYEGIWYVSAKNKRRPTIVDRDGKTPLTEADGRPYSGSYVVAVIEVYAITDPAKKGVHAALMGVQFSKDGDAFSGGGVASPDEFEDLGVPAGEPELV